MPTPRSSESPVKRSASFPSPGFTWSTIASLGAMLLFTPEGPGHNTPVKPPAIPLPVSGAVAVDPVPNTENQVTGLPLTGGVRYRWTVNLAGNSSTRFSDSVGAWGWDEDGNPATPTGRTEAAHWVALNLRSPSRVTFRVARKANVPDSFALFPGDLAGNQLRPAFTLHAGWDGDGGDEGTFPNRGAVPWAEDLRYLGHVETAGEIATGTYTLPAGRYTLVLGGNSTSLLPEPRQGYEATFSAVSLEKAPKYRITKGKTRFTKSVLRLSGRIGTPGEITSIRVYFRGKSRTLPVRRGVWTLTLRGMERGQNLIWITPVSKYGTVFPHQRLVVRRLR